MSDKILEQVSAFADDELHDAEASMLLVRLQRDAGLRAGLGRYQLIGEAMRGTLQVGRKDFSAGVMAAIETETFESPAASNALASVTGRIGRPLVGLAVAASVAMLAITTLQAPVGVPSGDIPVEVVPMINGVASTPVIPARQVDFSNVQSPELQNQLRSYLMNHNEHAGNSRLRGVMPYVQIAAQDSRPIDDDDSADSTDSNNGGTVPNDPQF